MTEPVAPAKRSHAIKYAVRDVVLVAREALAAGKELVYLNIGDPLQFDFETPPHIIDAICRALKDNRTGYAPSEGLADALDAIRTAAAHDGIRAIRDVFIGNGTSECIETALTALLDPGDEVLTPSPGYPLYPALLAKLGARQVPYPLDEQDSWQPDVQQMGHAITERTKAIVLINPNNPTGSVCRKSTLAAIIDLAARRNLLLMADEIYGDLVLDGEHVPLASLTDELPILTFGGLSKAHLGPGLRLGWCITSGPESRLREFVGAMHKFLRARLSASQPVQYAVRPALHGDRSHLVDMQTKLRTRRDITVEMLNAIDGISCVPPHGAFYAFAKLEQLEHSDEEFVKGLIRSTGVVVVHGSGFGQQPGTKHFRIVFLPPEAQLRRAFAAIDAYLHSL